MPGLPDLRDFVRAEPIPADATMLVRGGPDSVAKLAAHAQRVRRAFVLDGAPTLGISAFAALDGIGPASFEEILAGKLATYRLVHVASAGRLVAAGFDVLPTFGRPHGRSGSMRSIRSRRCWSCSVRHRPTTGMVE